MKCPTMTANVQGLEAFPQQEYQL